MKRLFILLLPIFMLFAFIQPTFAGFVSHLQPETVTPAKAEKATTRQELKQERKANKLMQKLERLASPDKAKGDDNMLLAIILAVFIGWTGIHRVYLGGSPLLIVGYLLLTCLFGLGWLLAIIDAIAMAVKGDTSAFQGNNKLFACFDALK
jgi:TM2 domain-containing membrane protein YozV